jgi:LuxR family maltose regulon positive regulatory protein
VAKDARRSGSQLDRLASPLLRAKLRRPPLVPKHHVRRTRLLRLLDEAVAAPVTLVVAPAGVGKTVLVSSWTAQSDVPTSWLTLDKTDRDGRELWPGMVAALEVLRPGCGEGALTVLRRSGPLSAVVHHLLEDLDAGAGTPGVLVVDDLHLVDDQEALDSLALFLQHLPTWLHGGAVVAPRARAPGRPPPLASEDVS